MRERSKVPWLVTALVVGLLSLTAYASVREPMGGARVGHDSEGLAMQELAHELEAHARSLDRREKTLAERESELRAIEARLEERAKTLEGLRAEIDSMREQVDEEHARKVSSLVKTVGSMKPAAAGAMLQELDAPLAIEVMKAMSSTKAAKLLAVLPPSFAAKLAEGIAGPGGPVGDRPVQAKP
jgi:flagellar motility protein MotE (MotC chaperone)